MTDQSYALVTKTWRGDLTAFRALCESVDMHMPTTRHYVLHDTSDAALLVPFASDTRVLVDTGELFPQFRELQVFGRRLWWLAPMRPVRGWIFQQLAKLAFVARMAEDAAVLVDSDAVLLRPIERHHVFAEGKTRHFRDPGAPTGPAGQGAAWHDVAARALGLEQRGYSGADYISNPLVWSPQVARALLAHIEETTGAPWYSELVKPLRFSEYVLYGMFCDHVSGPHRELIIPTAERLALISWGYDLSGDDGVDDFISAIGDKPAILIQSNLGLSAERRQEIVARAMAR